MAAVWVDDFDPVLAHQMLNSLNVLSGVLRLLEEPSPPADMTELCGLAHAHADRMGAALHALMRGDAACALMELSPQIG